MCLLNRLVTNVHPCFCLAKEGLTDRLRRWEGKRGANHLCLSGEGGTDGQHEEKGSQGSNQIRGLEKERCDGGGTEQNRER